MLPCPLVRSWDREFFLGGIAVRQIALQRPSKTYHPWQRQKNTRRETRASYYHKLQRLVPSGWRDTTLMHCFATQWRAYGQPSETLLRHLYGELHRGGCMLYCWCDNWCVLYVTVCVCVCVCERTFRDPCWNVMW